MALRRVRSARRCRLAVGNCFQLLEEFVGHEVDGWEEVDHTFEGGDGVTDMHPFHTVEARTQSGVELLVPAEQEFLESIVLDKLGRFAVCIKCCGKTEIFPGLGALQLLETQGLLLVGTLAAVPLGEVAKDVLQEAS